MSNDWVGLDDDMDASQGGTASGVQYVGVVETPDVSTPEVRVPRRPVQRVAPTARPIQSNGVVTRRGGRAPDQMVYFPTESGAAVALNKEAASNMARSRVHDIDGKPALRIRPGQYIMVVAGNRFADDQQPRRRAPRRQAAPVEGLGTDWAAFTQGLVGSLAQLGTGVTTAVMGERQSQRQAETERLRIAAEADAAVAARQAAAREAQRVHEENMARLRQQQAELQAVSAGGGASTAAVVTGGTSPVVWVVVAVAAIGGIGGLVWFLSNRKKSE